MERAERIAITRQILDSIDSDQPYLGEECWEGDIGRFIDKDRFELEKQKLFLERPQLIALTGDLPEAGDYYATDIAGKPILLVRGKDGEVRAFLNACRHRGVPLAEGCGHGEGFTCPYHGWTYNNDGALISVPSRQAFDPDKLRGLIPLQVVEEIGLIVVHPDPNGTFDFDEFMGPMKDHLKDKNLGEFRLVTARAEPGAINWKHAVDGGMEAYHVPFLHPVTIGTDGGGHLPHVQFGDHHAFITSTPDIVKLRGIPESEWPNSGGWGSVNAIFPNTVISDPVPAIFPDAPMSAPPPVMFFQRSEPGSEPGRCNYIFRTYARPAKTAEEQQRNEEFAKIMNRIAYEEDLLVQTASQKMMEAGAVPSVIFGKRESILTAMHKGYDEAIGHDVVAALRNNAVPMGISRLR